MNEITLEIKGVKISLTKVGMKNGKIKCECLFQNKSQVLFPTDLDEGEDKYLYLSPQITEVGFEAIAIFLNFMTIQEGDSEMWDGFSARHRAFTRTKKCELLREIGRYLEEEEYLQENWERLEAIADKFPDNIKSCMDSITNVAQYLNWCRGFVGWEERTQELFDSVFS